MNYTGFGLKLPLMLLTDTTPPPDVAQRLLYPVGHLLATQANVPIDSAVVAASIDTMQTITNPSESATCPGLIAIAYPPHDQASSVNPRFRLSANVAEKLVRLAPCPVMVMHGASSHKPTWKHVLLVVNRSDAAKQAIAIAHQLAPIGIERITILCVLPPLSAPYPLAPFSPLAMPAPSWQLTHSLQQVQKEQGDRLIQRAKTALQISNVEIQTVTQVAEPGPFICQLAQQADVIIMGEPLQWNAKANRHVFRHAHLNKTSHYVLHHAPCPVLFCPSNRATPVPAPRRLFPRPKIQLRLSRSQTEVLRSAECSLKKQHPNL